MTPQFSSSGHLPRSRRRHRRRGSALLLVMWLISMLSLLIYSTVQVVAHDMDITISQKKAFRARQLTEMGINIACNPVVKESDTALLNQVMGDGESFSVTIRGEGGRFNVNTLLQNKSRDFFERTFELWGLDKDAASAVTDCLLDWTDADEQKELHGMEREDFEELNYSGYPFDRPFYSLDEMLLVPGFDQVTALKKDWRDYFTIYSAGKLDLNAAEPKVIALGMNISKASFDAASQDFEADMKDAVEFVEKYRWGADGIEFTTDDQKVQSVEEAYSQLGFTPDSTEGGTYFGVNDTTVHIESVATVNDYRKRVVLVIRNRTQGTPQILAREEVPLFQ
ncbi:MAG: ral secretion pathway protein GspK [Verrucomicrobiales bacterium]|nr:ral secretion pathway protein GspK [Verrucomicrobiales bacterium]